MTTKDVIRKKVKVEKKFPFTPDFGWDVKYYCPVCNDMVLKYADSCNIISASLSKGCGTLLDWSDVP